MDATFPTPDSELNAVLREFVASARSVLGENFIGAYLQGSFAVGDWDAHSDVDFLIAVERDVAEAELPALQAMHARIYHLGSSWATHLEGSYFPRALLRGADPAQTLLLFLDNGGQTLVRSHHDNTLVVRWVVREHGITLAGPEPATLIDPIPADDLRREVVTVMYEWAGRIFAGRYRIDNQWAQPFAVLSYCRMLQTLATGCIESKRAGAEWARRELDARWTGLIERAWDARPDPGLKVRQPADPRECERTVAFMRYALARRRPVGYS